MPNCRSIKHPLPYQDCGFNANLSGHDFSHEDAMIAIAIASNKYRETFNAITGEIPNEVLQNIFTLTANTVALQVDVHKDVNPKKIFEQIKRIAEGMLPFPYIEDSLEAYRADLGILEPY